MNIELKKRLQSLTWRAGGMAAVVGLNGILALLTDGTINAPAPYVVFAGLLVGELTKFIGKKCGLNS